MRTKNRSVHEGEEFAHTVQRGQAEVPTHHTTVAVGWACILAGLLARLYASAPSIDLWLVLAVTVAIVLLPATKLRMRAVDWSVLLLAAFEIPSLLFSQYRANSISTSGAIAVAVLVYFAVRLTIRTPLEVASLAGVLGLGGAWLAFSGLRQFDVHTKLLGAAGLTDLVAFRFRLMSPPAPWVLGEWLTVLLLALPFACALPAYLWQAGRRWLVAVTLAVPLLIAAALSLSLSRAVFWSTVLFCFAVCAFMAGYRAITLRTGGLLLASALGALALILTCECALYPGILRAYTGQHASQTRSTQGRFGIWNRSLEVVRAHPLWGVGSSNAALALTSTADQDETTEFASRTFSLPVQVLVEKGSIGVLLYAAFLFLVGREFHHTMRSTQLQPATSAQIGSSRGSVQSAGGTGPSTSASEPARKAMACCFAAGLVAVLFRELTYSSVLEHNVTLVLVFTLSALLCAPERV